MTKTTQDYDVPPLAVDGLRQQIEEEKAAERERIEWPLKVLVWALQTPPPDGFSPEDHQAALRVCADAAVKDLGPTDRAALLLELPQGERETLERAYPALFAEVEREALAAHSDAQANVFEKLASLRASRGQPRPEARAMAAAKRRAARAIREQDDPSVEMRESWRATRKGLNRARGRLGLHPLPVPRQLRLPACHGARHRRAPGAKPIRRPGSRRTTAPTRGDPDEGELPGDIASPLPIGGRR